MTITPSLLRVLTASFGFALLFDISLILVLSISVEVRKPEPLFYFAMFGVLYIICYALVYLSTWKTVVVDQKSITLHHHFEPVICIFWEDINWADYRRRPCCLWRIFSRQGNRLLIPHGRLSNKDEKALSCYIIKALPDMILNRPSYPVHLV